MGRALERHGIPPYIVVERIRLMRTKSPRQTTSRELKRERLELRVAASAKQLIQRAIAVTGLTAGDLAYEGARQVLDEHERMLLTGADRQAFLDAVMSPPA